MLRRRQDDAVIGLRRRHRFLTVIMLAAMIVSFGMDDI